MKPKIPYESKETLLALFKEFLNACCLIRNEDETIILITEDDVALREGDEFYTVIKNSYTNRLHVDTCARLADSKILNYPPTTKIFKCKQKAKDYVIRNSEIFSYNDISQELVPDSSLANLKRKAELIIGWRYGK